MPELVRALADRQYIEPTPVQARVIPEVLAGRDILAGAQTGTGKTAAFTLPILQRLQAEANPPRSPRVLVLVPTRELAAQVHESIRSYGKYLRLRSLVIFGGVSINPQIENLRRGTDILVATPGRLLDHAQQRTLDLSRIEVLVLDEADRMLDMGFIHDVKKIVAVLPKTRQSLLFSATMPSNIEHLAAEILNDPVRVEVRPEVITVDKVDQRVLHVDGKRKRELLTKLLDDNELSRVIVFTRTKHCANRVSEQLEKGGIPSEAIHGNKSQGARQRALEAFRNGDARVLVATDIAARGIDVDGITHVINFELPNEPESYVHRIGRTARAGASGIAYSFCDASERPYLKSIERLTRRTLTVYDTKPLIGDQPSPEFANEPREQRRPNGSRGNQGQRPKQGQRNGGGANNGNRNHGQKSHGNGNGGTGNGGNARPDAISRNRPGSRARKRVHAGGSE
jgi:ATP-dependent RNA helicase RhlE